MRALPFTWLMPLSLASAEPTPGRKLLPAENDSCRSGDAGGAVVDEACQVPRNHLPAAGRPMVDCIRRDLGEQRSDESAGDYVAGIVNTGVNTRIADHGREPAQRNPHSGHHMPDSGGEGERGSGVAGWERGRRRHLHVTRDWHLSAGAVRPPAATERLRAEVDEGGRDGDRREPEGGGAPSPATSEGGEAGGRNHREPRIVGRIRE